MSKAQTPFPAQIPRRTLGQVQVVSFHCTLKNKLGRVISSSFNQGVLTELGRELRDEPRMLLGLAEGLQDVKAGDRREIFVPAQDAYGLYDASQIITVSKKNLKPHVDLNVGSEILGYAAGGSPRMFRVLQVTSKQVTLDANHPLAGQDLIFEIEVTDARIATEAEIKEAAEPPLTRDLLH